MQFPEKLIPGTLIKRYKRFLADVELSDGSIVTAHCPNSGRMTQCQEEGWKVLLSPANNPNRKLKYTWELVHNGQCWICVNTQRANEVSFEAVTGNQIPELSGYEKIEREKKYGEKSRIDILLSNDDELCYVEVKSVTLTNEGKYTFPDAPTERGQKHLDELMEMEKQGHRAVMLFILMRSDAQKFEAAKHIDPVYAEKLADAKNAGVEVLVYNTTIVESSIVIGSREQ